MALSLDEALGMSLADETDDSIHVDIDTRQVTIPESQQVFGVESDEDVEVKHIVIDGRYNDGTDLSAFTFRVNYQNANGDKGTYLATELKVNDDSIEFDWVIGRQVVAYKGTIAFIVCAYTIDSSSVIQNEWNSTLGKGTTLEGLEVSEFDFGDDIVRQLASILSDVNAAQASAKASADEAYKSKTEVVALGKEQQAAIEKKGKDTLATIPEDYTQISNDVSQLKEDTKALKDGKISKFYASSQGDTTLLDSDSGRLVDLKLYGNSEQQHYSGKNLLSTLNISTSTKLGVTAKSAGSGEISIKGTATADVMFDYWEQTISVPKGARVLCKNLQGIGSANNEVTFYGENFTSGLVAKFGAVSSTGASADYECVMVRVYIKSGETVDCTIGLSLQMDSSTDYEPYVGGIPSPNPEYPQEIKSVVNPTVKVMGKNLFNPTNGERKSGLYTTNSCTYTHQNGIFTISATGEDAYIGDFINVGNLLHDGCIVIRVNAKKKYHVTLYGDFDKFVGGCANADKKVLATYFSISDFNNATLKTDAKYIFIRPGISTSRDGKIYTGYIQVEEGENGTYYQPYIEQIATLPYTLNAIPVTSGGNVTIAGQQYIADYVDVERGKLVRLLEYKKVVASKVEDLTDAKRLYIATDDIWDRGTYTARSFPLMCSIGDGNLVTVSNSGWSGKSKCVLTGMPFATLTDAKTYFDSHDAYACYPLATPTETDLTADEIAAFKALVSHYPVTNVSTTSDQLDGYTVFNYPISLANGWNYVKQQLGDTRDYLYGIDLMTAEAYVNSEYAAALAEIEV